MKVGDTIKNKIKPLGYIELPSGKNRAVIPMNDIFLNYMFDKEEYWGISKDIVNILSDEYSETTSNKTHKMPYIEGEVIVETQFQYLLESATGKNTLTPRNQDIKVLQKGDNDGNQVFIEFQNHPSAKPFIGDRGLQYFGLGIGHNPEYKTDQVWLLAKVNNKVDEDLLLGKVFSNYSLKNEENITHPNTSSITYINLDKLSEQNSKAGELASVLLGKELEISNPEVKKIASSFNNAFGSFKMEKEVSVMYMTFQERWRLEAIEEGREEGIEQGREEGIEKGIEQTIERYIKKIGTGQVTYDEISDLFGVGLDKAKEIHQKVVDEVSKDPKSIIKNVENALKTHVKKPKL